VIHHSYNSLRYMKYLILDIILFPAFVLFWLAWLKSRVVPFPSKPTDNSRKIEKFFENIESCNMSDPLETLPADVKEALPAPTSPSMPDSIFTPRMIESAYKLVRIDLMLDFRRNETHRGKKN
jgi:hypothetical protein